MSMLSNNSLTAERFIIFLKNLREFLNESHYFAYKNVAILLDNFPSHRTNRVVENDKTVVLKYIIFSILPVVSSCGTFFWITEEEAHTIWKGQID